MKILQKNNAPNYIGNTYAPLAGKLRQQIRFLVSQEKTFWRAYNSMDGAKWVWWGLKLHSTGEDN